MYKSIYACKHSHMYNRRIHVRIYFDIHLYVYTPIFYMCTRIFMCLHVYMYTNMYGFGQQCPVIKNLNIHTFICTHTKTHMYI